MANGRIVPAHQLVKVSVRGHVIDVEARTGARGIEEVQQHGPAGRAQTHALRTLPNGTGCSRSGTAAFASGGNM